MNQDILKQRYSEYRIKMKSLPLGKERSLVKEEMSMFLREVATVFGQDVASEITKKS